MVTIKREVNNKLRGAFGATSFNKNGVVKVEINKARHSNPRALKNTRTPKRDQTLINTIKHEETHALHPKMHEDTVRKVTRMKVSKMGPKEKARVYSKYK